MVQRDTIEDYLARYDLVVARDGDSAWRGTFPAIGRSFRFHLRLAGDWLHFTVAPALDAIPRGPGEARALFSRMLAINAEMKLAKYALDGAGGVVLGVDLPTADLDFSELKEALDRLRSYAAGYHDELAALANGAGPNAPRGRGP